MKSLEIDWNSALNTLLDRREGDNLFEKGLNLYRLYLLYFQQEAIH